MCHIESWVTYDCGALHETSGYEWHFSLDLHSLVCETKHSELRIHYHNMGAEMENKSQRRKVSPHHLCTTIIRLLIVIIHTPIRQAFEVKYLVLNLDHRLTWKTQINKNRKRINLKLKILYWIIGRTSILAIENKILEYKSVIRPIWSYGCKVWGCDSNSSINIMQRFVKSSSPAIGLSMVCKQSDTPQRLQHSSWTNENLKVR